jgi:hypothetical protein
VKTFENIRKSLRAKITPRRVLIFGLLFFAMLGAGLFGLYKIVRNPKPLLAAINKYESGRRNARAKNTTPRSSEPVSAPNLAGLEKIKAEYRRNFFYRYEIPDTDGYLHPRISPSVEIPETVKMIAGIDREKGYIARLNAVHSLGNNSLSGQEINALLYFLHKKADEDVLPLLEFDAIKNDVANALLNQKYFPSVFPLRLIAMFYDKSFDNVWRDYCVQFLSQCYPKMTDPEEREIVKNLFFAALDDEDGIPGAALIALAGLAGNPGIDRQKVSEAAYKLLADPAVPDTIKITALQIAAKFKNPEVLPMARGLIGESKNVPLKISAIAVVGAMGGSSDRKTLNALLKNGDIRLRTASKAALGKLNKIAN